MLAVLAATAAAFAEPPAGQPQAVVPSTITAAATVKKPTTTVKKVEIYTSLSKKQSSSGVSPKIERIDGMSSQPWVKMAGPDPGYSAFPRPERRDPLMNVFWIGAPPPQ